MGKKSFTVNGNGKVTFNAMYGFDEDINIKEYIDATVVRGENSKGRVTGISVYNSAHLLVDDNVNVDRLIISDDATTTIHGNVGKVAAEGGSILIETHNVGYDSYVPKVNEITADKTSITIEGHAASIDSPVINNLNVNYSEVTLKSFCTVLGGSVSDSDFTTTNCTVRDISLSNCTTKVAGGKIANATISNNNMELYAGASMTDCKITNGTFDMYGGYGSSCTATGATFSLRGGVVVSSTVGGGVFKVLGGTCSETTINPGDSSLIGEGTLINCTIHDPNTVFYNSYNPASRAEDFSVCDIKLLDVGLGPNAEWSYGGSLSIKEHTNGTVDVKDVNLYILNNNADIYCGLFDIKNHKAGKAVAMKTGSSHITSMTAGSAELIAPGTIDITSMDTGSLVYAQYDSGNWAGNFILGTVDSVQASMLNLYNEPSSKSGNFTVTGSANNVRIQAGNNRSITANFQAALTKLTANISDNTSCIVNMAGNTVGSAAVYNVGADMKNYVVFNCTNSGGTVSAVTLSKIDSGRINAANCNGVSSIYAADCGDVSAYCGGNVVSAYMKVLDKHIPEGATGSSNKVVLKAGGNISAATLIGVSSLDVSAGNTISSAFLSCTLGPVYVSAGAAIEQLTVVGAGGYTEGSFTNNNITAGSGVTSANIKYAGGAVTLKTPAIGSTIINAGGFTVNNGNNNKVNSVDYLKATATNLTASVNIGSANHIEITANKQIIMSVDSADSGYVTANGGGTISIGNFGQGGINAKGNATVGIGNMCSGVVQIDPQSGNINIGNNIGSGMSGGTVIGATDQNANIWVYTNQAIVNQQVKVGNNCGLSAGKLNLASSYVDQPMPDQLKVNLYDHGGIWDPVEKKIIHRKKSIYVTRVSSTHYRVNPSKFIENYAEYKFEAWDQTQEENHQFINDFVETFRWVNGNPSLVRYMVSSPDMNVPFTEDCELPIYDNMWTIDSIG